MQYAHVLLNRSLQSKLLACRAPIADQIYPFDRIVQGTPTNNRSDIYVGQMYELCKHCIDMCNVYYPYWKQLCYVKKRKIPA